MEGGRKESKKTEGEEEEGKEEREGGRQQSRSLSLKALQAHRSIIDA